MATKTTLNSIKAFINTKPIISTDYSNMSFIEERERIQFAVGNIVTDDYFPELKAKCVKVHLDDKEIQGAANVVRDFNMDDLEDGTPRIVYTDALLYNDQEDISGCTPALMDDVIEFTWNK